MTAVDTTEVQVAIIGAGFSGIAVAAELTRTGIDDFLILERGDSVGGVWRDNSYPGCRCDIPSLLYSYSFAPKPDWSDHYAAQGEILDYLTNCSEDLELADRLVLSTTLIAAAWDQSRRRWSLRVATDSGGGEPCEKTVLARMLVLATGAQSEPLIPKIDGLPSFAGTTMHSARWAAEFDPTNRRIGVIGTGASAIQLVPELAKSAASVSVFQRTPAWVLPRSDHPIHPVTQRAYRSAPRLQSAARTVQFTMKETMSQAFLSVGSGLDAMEHTAVRHLETQVADQGLREHLTPDFRIGCKRILMSDDWYPTLQLRHVDLVTDPIHEITDSGVTTSGSEPGGPVAHYAPAAADPVDTHHPVDTLILATGFLVTRQPILFKVTGATGKTIAQTWGMTRPSAYLGSTVTDFPNMLIMTGPNTGLANNSMVILIEAQAGYAAQMASHLVKFPSAVLDVKPEVADAYTDDVEERLKTSVWVSGGCSSWYQDSKGRVSTLWPGTLSQYRRLIRKLKLSDYEGH